MGYLLSDEQKQKKREYQRSWYLKNRNKVLAANENWRQNNKSRKVAGQLEYNRQKKLRVVRFLGGKCSNCNGVFPACVYDCHHLDPKEKDVNISKIMSFSWQRIQKELEKCVLLCANCHRLVHSGD